MKTLSTRIVAFALVLAFFPATGSAMAGTSFDFLFNVNHVSDDNQYFLNLAVANYRYDRRVLEPIVPRLRYVEADLPVVLFLAEHSGRPPSVIVDLRAQGYGWSAIFTRLHVAPDVLFAGIPSDPGPPYGKAWGHWKKSRRGVRLSDTDIIGLVQIQIGSRFAGVAPIEMARARGQGRRVATLVAEKKGRPYKGKHDRGGK